MERCEVCGGALKVVEDGFGISLAHWSEVNARECGK